MMTMTRQCNDGQYDDDHGIQCWHSGLTLHDGDNQDENVHCYDGDDDGDDDDDDDEEDDDDNRQLRLRNAVAEEPPPQLA